MEKFRYNSKKIACLIAIILLIITTFNPLAVSDFELPEWGGGMVHSDPQMSENIRKPVPIENVGELWRRSDLGGEHFGTWGNGVASNGKICAQTFTNYLGRDNLIIYDYYGNQIWDSGFLLNFLATSSSPMVDINNQVVACDNKTLVLINASNPDNVFEEWNSSIDLGTFRETKGVPFSPTIVEERTIILPTKGGPLLAYDVDNGNLIANLTLGQNETIEPYWGIPHMSFINYSIMMMAYNKFSVCPYYYNSTTQLVENGTSLG